MAHGARCAKTAVHHAVGISRQKNSAYRSSRVNIIAQGLSTSLSVPSLSPYTHLSKKGRSCNSYTTHTIDTDGVMLHYTSPIPGVAHWASLWGMRRQRVLPHRRKKEKVLSDLWAAQIYRLVSGLCFSQCLVTYQRPLVHEIKKQRYSISNNNNRLSYC